MNPLLAGLLWAAGGFLVCKLLGAHPKTPAAGFGADGDGADIPDPWVRPPPPPPTSGAVGCDWGLTPERAALHQRLMCECHDPDKLTRAAALFGAEGLSDLAGALLRKAGMIHQQMHGARDLVERFRAGDQHAIAMIDSIGKAARAGHKRAQVSSFLITDYTMRNPAPRGAPAVAPRPAAQPAGAPS